MFDKGKKQAKSISSQKSGKLKTGGKCLQLAVALNQRQTRSNPTQDQSPNHPINKLTNNQIMTRKPCPVCGKHIVGRADKKFCSASCKNKFHHPSQHIKGDVIKTVNQFLFQNFKIMESVFKEEKSNQLTVPRILLNKMGFHFDYCTGCYINNKGKLYHYIYDYAWMEFSTQELMLIRKKK